MAAPKNLSRDTKGFNSRMFKSERAVRRGFMMLGYGVNTCEHKVPSNTVRQFQRDYNKCANRFGHWGQVKITGKLNRDTLNALEHAIRWSKKRENDQGIPSARSWQSLCGDRRAACIDTDECESGRRKYGQTDLSETNFVEVLPNGSGKLRNIHTDDSLRCDIICFERHGDVVFSTVNVPSQGDLPGGRPNSITCPCVFAR